MLAGSGEGTGTNGRRCSGRASRARWLARAPRYRTMSASSCTAPICAPNAVVIAATRWSMPSAGMITRSGTEHQRYSTRVPAHGSTSYVTVAPAGISGPALNVMRAGMPADRCRRISSSQASSAGTVRSMRRGGEPAYVRSPAADPCGLAQRRRAAPRRAVAPPPRPARLQPGRRGTTGISRRHRLLR